MLVIVNVNKSKFIEEIGELHEIFVDREFSMSEASTEYDNVSNNC